MKNSWLKQGDLEKDLEAMEEIRGDELRERLPKPCLKKLTRAEQIQRMVERLDALEEVVGALVMGLRDIAEAIDENR